VQEDGLGQDMVAHAKEPAMATQARQLMRQAEEVQQQHPGLRGFLTKLGKDNIGMLAAFVAWSILTSVVPIVVGLVAISGFALRNPSLQQSVISHLSQALQGALSTSDITAIVKTATQHAGLLGIIGFLGVLWGGSNVGGSISTAFQAIFEVSGRSFVREKLLDVAMIFVFTALMIVILIGTTAGALLNRLFSGFPLPSVTQFVIGTAISLAAEFLLFAVIYLVFPNTVPRFRIGNIWRGALLASVLFQILNFGWPIYARFSHFQRYGAVLFPILVLTAWIYFFALILMIGAEVVAVASIQEAQAHDQAIGPSPQDSVPQHEVLRGQKQQRSGAGKAGRRNKTPPQQHAPREDARGGVIQRYYPRTDGEVERDPAFWLLAATPLAVAALAGAYEVLTGRRPT
jgi:YihY family inner membrane protein